MTLEKARPWLAKADRDWSVIRACLEILRLPEEPAPWDAVCFHAQQAAEKSLKGWLAAHGRPVRRTHDLVNLLSECAALDPGMETLKDDCFILADYSTAVRYPNELAEHEPGEKEGREAVDAARRIKKAVEASLGLRA